MTHLRSQQETGHARCPEEFAGLHARQRKDRRGCHHVHQRPLPGPVSSMRCETTGGKKVIDQSRRRTVQGSGCRCDRLPTCKRSELCQDVWKYCSGPTPTKTSTPKHRSWSQRDDSVGYSNGCFLFLGHHSHDTLSRSRSQVQVWSALRVSTERDHFRQIFLHLCCSSLFAAPYGCALIFSASILCSRDMTCPWVPPMVSFFVFVVIGR